MSDVYILGAGSLARETIGWIRNDNDFNMNIVGFVDPYFDGTELSGLEVFKDFTVINHSFFIVGVSKPAWRNEFVIAALAANGRPLSYIHSSAIISENFVHGEGLFIAPCCTISCNVEIGDFVHVNVRTSIGHDSKVGNFSILLGGNVINGCVAIGESVTVGSGAVVHPGKSVLDSATIGIGSVVIRNVKASTTVFGVPAKLIGRKR